MEPSVKSGFQGLGPEPNTLLNANVDLLTSINDHWCDAIYCMMAGSYCYGCVNASATEPNQEVDWRGCTVKSNVSVGVSVRRANQDQPK